MANKIKNSIWSIFYLCLFFSLVIFCIISSATWKSTKKEFIRENVSNVKLLARSSNLVLLSINNTLNLLTNELINFKKIKTTIGSAIGKDSNILGVALVDENTKIVSSSSHLHKQSIINVVKKTLTNKNVSFLDEDSSFMDEDDLILGEIYFFKECHSYILPVYKKIVYNNKKFFLFAFLKENANNGVFNNNKNVYFINSKNDKYLFFKTISQENRVNQKISLKDKKNFLKNLKISLSEFKKLKKEKTVYHKFSGKKTYTTIQYNSKFRYFIGSSITLKSILQAYYFKLAYYGMFFILFVLFLYVFSKKVSIANKKEIKTLSEKNYIDHLTRVYNKYYFKEINKKIYDNKLSSFSLIQLEIEDLKNISHLFTEKSSDKILVLLSQRIELIFNYSYSKFKHFTIKNDGNGFTIIVEGIGRKKLSLLVKRLYNRAVCSYPITPQKKVLISVSIGISIFPKDTNDFNELKKFASFAQQKAKENNKNYQFFNFSFKEKYEEKLKLNQKLKQAVLEKNFTVVFQPQVDRDKRICGVEALARWKDTEENKNIDSEVFIALAEELDLMNELGVILLEKTFAGYNKILKNLKKPISLSVNVSLQQFVSDNFFSLFKKEIELFGFDTNLIMVEVTENNFIKNISALEHILKKIKSIGVKISIDDFGTGYSSLSLLTKLPINELKVDKSFVFKMFDSKEDTLLIKSIISLGKNLNKKIVCEGVEKENFFYELVSMGADIFQGYYFSKPVTENEIIVKYNNQLNLDYCKPINLNKKIKEPKSS